MLKPADTDEPGLMLKSQALPTVKDSMRAVQGSVLNISVKTASEH